jgi:hypothetical protein
MGVASSWGTAACVMLAAIFGAGCTTIEGRFQRLPSEEALRGIEPGVTTRSEVLERLGPPEEMRRPAVFIERAPTTAPQRRKVLEAGDLFSDDRYTYATVRLRADRFGLMPVGPPLARVTWVASQEDRWLIEFDQGGVVRAVSHVDEIE